MHRTEYDLSDVVPQRAVGWCKAVYPFDRPSSARSMPRLLQFIHGRGVLCQRGAGMNCNWLQDMSRRQTKVFRCSSFSKMLPRCRRAAHICGANQILQSVFPAAIAFLKTVQFKQSCIMRIKVVNSSKATGQLQHAGRQKQGWNPLLPDASDRFL